MTLVAKWEASEPGAQTAHESSHENSNENTCENKHENCDQNSHENFLHGNIVVKIFIPLSVTIFMHVFTLVFITVFMATFMTGFMLLVWGLNGYLVCNLLDTLTLFLFKGKGRVVVRTRLLIWFTLECVFIKKTKARADIIFTGSSQRKLLS